jgi:hypothetical protein
MDGRDRRCGYFSHMDFIVAGLCGRLVIEITA